ncbi:MAG: chemotaxis protein CheW [Xenococcaceae cyanobacterium]
MNREFFVVELSTSIRLGLNLEEMTTVTQFEQKDICIVPGVAPFWYGVVNFKGSLLWVLDIDRFLNLAGSVETLSDRWNLKLTSILLTYQIQGIQKRVALAVKKLDGLLTVQSSQLQPISSDAPSSLKAICKMAIEKENTITYILDVETLFQQLHQHSTLVNA